MTSRIDAKRQIYLQAVVEGIKEEMRREARVFFMGEDVRSPLFYGPTGNFLEEFGPERVRNTPLSEAAFVGAAIGAAMTGMRPVVDITIATFLYMAMDQLVSQAAKIRYMFGGQARVPLVVRATNMYGAGLAAQHSDRPHATFMTIPGLKIVAPATGYDAKGLMKSAIRDDDPVLFFEDVTLHGHPDEIPEAEYLIPIGKADIKRIGGDATVIAISGAVPHALAAASELATEGISIEVIDLRTLVPMDVPTVLESVAKTGRVVIADPAHRTCSAASEIAAIIAEESFWSLRAPIFRVTTPQIHVPFSPALEKDLYPNAAKISTAVRALVSARR